MRTIAKRGQLYIWRNVASPSSDYWNDTDKRWTTFPHFASFYDTPQDAQRALERATASTECEVLLLRAEKDVRG